MIEAEVIEARFANAILAANRRGQEEMRERAAKAAKRKCDELWVVFSRKNPSDGLEAVFREMIAAIRALEVQQ